MSNCENVLTEFGDYLADMDDESQEGKALALRMPMPDETNDLNNYH